uniref:Uncharacterized protein n=1 Tax=Rhizophora mucronata TaxID=61149 RepID=A0A2P2PSS0_RHIMU
MVLFCKIFFFCIPKCVYNLMLCYLELFWVKWLLIRHLTNYYIVSTSSRLNI